MTRPIRTDAYPVYLCGKCGSEYSESVDYVNKVGKILCICGEIIKTDPIKSVDLSFGNTVQRTTNKQNEDIEPYVVGLMSLGFTKTEAKKKIMERINESGYSNLDDIIKEVLV